MPHGHINNIRNLLHLLRWEIEVAPNRLSWLVRRASESDEEEEV